MSILATVTKVNQVKAWEHRRRMQGVEPTADELWGYIAKRWPGMQYAEQREQIFQLVGRQLTPRTPSIKVHHV